MEFEIGTHYINSKNRLCVIKDILKTFNSKGELIKTRYVAEHDFMGQKIEDNDVLHISIQKGMEALVNA